MQKNFEKRLKALADLGPRDLLAGGLKGVEKESLRVTAEGRLSRRPHPAGLGSALTNRYITTDFSEALLEFVTPAFEHTWETLQFLCDVHEFTYENIGDELLWVASMPCVIPGDSEIPLARYGSSNVGRMKTVYRRGLGYRYGRAMQTISGVHFNYSVPEGLWSIYRDVAGAPDAGGDLRSAAYLGLIRNVRRFGWLLLFLFGASPALCKSFARGRNVNLSEFDKDTWFEPFATSLRMSDLGYSNKTQATINISLNSLDEYIGDLTSAINTPEPAYEKIGVVRDGEYLQLSANKLQIENEFYSPVRPKRAAKSGERPTSALKRGGIEYVEIRSLDINPFDPSGINQNSMRFMEAFLLYCLLADSPPMDTRGWEETTTNHARTARHGRDPAFLLKRGGHDVLLRDWAAEIVEGVAAVAELIDRGVGGTDYSAAVRAQAELVRDADGTPSARILEDLRREKTNFFYYAMNLARTHRDYFASIPAMSAETRRLLETEAAESLDRQAAIEAADEIPFAEYLAAYYAS